MTNITKKRVWISIVLAFFVLWTGLQTAVPAFAAQEPAVTATPAPDSTRGGIPWTPVIIVSSIISLVIAIVLAVRKANKVFGKGFD